MTTWTPQELTRLATADELRITTTGKDGPRTPVPIWVVCVGEEVYVRSWRGRDGAWYRRASRDRAAHIDVPGVDRDVVADQPAPEIHDQIDAAYRAKYARYGDTYLQPMISRPAREATLRLTPR